MFFSPRNDFQWIVPMITIMFVLMVIVNYDASLYEPKRLSDEPPRRSDEAYANFTAPSQGTLRLSKGVATQIHHTIKNDSVIVLTRKSLDGGPGRHLVIRDLEPNKKFVVASVGDDGVVATDDSGEVYFVVI